MRILMITSHLPYPTNSGYPLRIYNLLYRLARGHEIWLATFIPAGQSATYVSHLQKFCQGIETVVFQNKGVLDHPLDALLYLMKGLPPDLRIYRSHELTAKIRDLINRIDFDIIQIEDSHMGIYLERIPKEIHPKTLLTFHDVNFRKYDRMTQVETKNTRKARIWLHSRMMRCWEPFYAEKFGRCIAMSDSDRCLLQAANPRLKIDVIPNGVDTNQYQPLPYSENVPVLIFVGNMAYRPNIDAVTYFCLSIYPRIKREFPQVEFWIVGKNPSSEVIRLSGNGVRVTGQVDDLVPYYSSSAVSVVPLRAGGGTRLKILEAMALGRPVVTTLIGCEGLDVVNGKHLLIADSPNQFAEHTLQLLRNKQTWLSITQQARDLVVNRYDWDVIAQSLEHLFEDMQCEEKNN
jgi:sugar transferase (PEP-CTERM/EpsH1 system associated)